MAKIIRFRLGGKTYRVKDCKGIASARGLMFDDLKNKDGALIYANNIWMPFVKHKLKLFFLDKNFRVLSTQDAVPLTINPKTWRTYSHKKAKYCLEIKAN